MKFYDTKKGRPPRVAWIADNGDVIDAGTLADQIRAFYPSLVGAHISKQIEALKLAGSFERGTTPAPLPWTFA